MTEEGVIASLVCSSGEAISDCFASLATAKNAAGLLRFARSDAQKESLRARLFFSEAVSGIPHRFAAFRMTDEEKFAGANREILTVTAEKDPSW
jgi:hypothetical protein